MTDPGHLESIFDTHEFTTIEFCTDCQHVHPCHETGRAYWQCEWCATGRQSADPSN